MVVCHVVCRIWSPCDSPSGHADSPGVPRFAVIYKITYPNGKIYVGQDLRNTLTYFGSVAPG
jgi:hypothetical protein